MNLKVIHVVFVVCSTLLAFLFGGWSLAQGGATFVVAGVVAFACGVALIAYGVWFWRKVRTPAEERRHRLSRIHKVGAALALAWLLGGERAAHACQVCYGNAEGGLIDASRAGVFMLLGLVLLLQLALLLFFLTLRRRAKAHYKKPVPPWWSTVEEPIEP